ncbi:MAG: hypothetical protein M3268_09395, partial [Acidobacteriota bacterium]|nr:hypothetical protein [Acidobacteriota bacterium]
MLLACSSAATRASDGGSELSSVESARQQMVVRLRSFVPGASGRVVVEPSEEGGRVRLLASRLPAPETVAAGARVYVVWATGGEVRRVGLLRRDARGDASFEFAHPSGFTSYSLVVTAERDERATYPAGAFVFSTRAGEVSAFYPPKPEPRAAAKESARATESPRAGGTAVRSRTVTNARTNTAATSAPAPSPATGTRAAPSSTPDRSASSPTGARSTSSPTNERAPSPPAVPRSTTGARTPTGTRVPSSEYAAEFYESINSAVEDPASARTLTLEGVGGARRARGEARVATREGTA